MFQTTNQMKIDEMIWWKTENPVACFMCSFNLRGANNLTQTICQKSVNHLFSPLGPLSQPINHGILVESEGRKRESGS